MFFYTYVMECLSENGRKSFYIGSTGNLVNRLAEHKRGKVRTTSRFKNLSLVYYEACRSKGMAINRELQLKTGFGRSYLKNRIYGKDAGLV